MIIIVASRYDSPACRFKDRQVGESVCLLTGEDLSVAGWRYRVSDPSGSIAMIGGLPVNQSEISGVLTRLEWVWEGELLEIVENDRAYVAAEMSAFLVSWLSELTCPILNRPSPGSLNGPAWGRERWNFAASKAGMRVAPIRRRASLTLSSKGDEERDEEARESLRQVSVTVVGNRCVGDVHETLGKQARRLANIAKMDLLAVQFSSAEPDATFVSACALADIENSAVAEAVLNYFGRT